MLATKTCKTCSFQIFGENMGMGEKAGDVSLCGNVREKRDKCGSLPPNAGGLATICLQIGDIDSRRTEDGRNVLG